MQLTIVCTSDSCCPTPDMTAPFTSSVHIDHATPAQRFLFGRAYPRICRSELTRLLCHTLAWCALLESNTAWIWICEPNVHVDAAHVKDMHESLNVLMQTVHVLSIDSDAPSSGPSAARSYLISCAGAMKLLDDMFIHGVCAGGIDAILTMQNCTEANVVRATHACVTAFCVPVHNDDEAVADRVDLCIGETLIFIKEYDAIGAVDDDAPLTTWRHPIALLLCRPQAEWDAVNTRGQYKRGHDIPRAWVPFPTLHDGVCVRASVLDNAMLFQPAHVRLGTAYPCAPCCWPVLNPAVEEIGDAFHIPVPACFSAFDDACALANVLRATSAVRIAVIAPSDMQLSQIQHQWPRACQWGRLLLEHEVELADFVVRIVPVCAPCAADLRVVQDAHTHKTVVFPLLSECKQSDEGAWPSSSSFLHVHSFSHHSPIAIWDKLDASIEALEECVYKHDSTPAPSCLAHYAPSGT